MKKCYRIVADGFAGYEVQAWRWWFPFWVQVGVVNTHFSIEDAKQWIKEGCPENKIKKEQKVYWKSC